MFENIIQSIFSAVFLASILRVATPILLPSLGALVSDRAGVINIGLEGIMLAAAFAGAAVNAYAQTWFGPDTGKLMGTSGRRLQVVCVRRLRVLILAVFHRRFKTYLI